jgi:hypothetical protein
VTGTNAFTISVTEMETNFSTACGMSDCTSSWTWMMMKGSKTPPGCQ